MATNILTGVLKADIIQKQNKLEFDYSSTGISKNFMKIFETANKSYNFNYEKTENCSSGKPGKNSPEKFSSDEELSLQSNKDKESSDNSDSKDILEESYSENPVHPGQNSTTNTKDNYDKQAENKTSKEAVNASSQQSENSKTPKNVEKATSNEAVNSKTSGNEEKVAAQATENNKTDKSSDKQVQQSIKAEPAKETAGKILLEKAATEEKNVNTTKNTDTTTDTAAGKTADKKVMTNIEVKKEVNTTDNNNSTAKKPEKAEEEIKLQQNTEKKDTEKTKPEIPNITEHKDKSTEKNPEPQPSVDNKAKNDSSKDDKKLPPEQNLKQAEVKEDVKKEDLKLENIKIAANAELQKHSGESMTRQGQQNSGHEPKAGNNQSIITDSNSQKIDFQKIAQFDKVLSSKNAESTHRSIINQVKNASAQLANGKSEVSINLRPENLGKVNINLVSQKGELTARITTDNNQTREMLSKGLESLKQSLSEQGINVNRVVVNSQESQSKGESNFDTMAKFDQKGNSSGADSNSSEDGHLAENGHEPANPESYDFEEDGEEEPVSSKIGHLAGNVDYKV